MLHPTPFPQTPVRKQRVLTTLLTRRPSREQSVLGWPLIAAIVLSALAGCGKSSSDAAPPPPSASSASPAEKAAEVASPTDAEATLQAPADPSPAGLEGLTLYLA
jgi:hypothetical protein